MYLLFVYFLTFLTIFKLNSVKNFKDSILHTTLVFSALIVFITETLSLFRCINLLAIIIFWGGLSLVLIYFLLKEKRKTLENLKTIKFIVIDGFKSLKIYEKWLLIIIVIGFLALFFQGIVYPPNNWDSLTYHLSRIMYWIGNGSVEHFPTHILRHLYQPPFAEYCIMHINLLNGNDYLSNSLQLFFLFLSIICIWSILDYFKTSKFHKLIAAFLLITIPSVELQATTTKNDLICGFFVLAVLYFVIKTYYETKLKNFIFLGLAIGLGMLTKGTAYLFLAPILLLFPCFIIFKLVKTKDLKILKNLLILAFIVLLLNLGHYSRNYKINHNVLNIDETEAKMYINSEMNGGLLVSNFLKNIGLHIDYPLATLYDGWIRDFHYNNEINIDNPATNYFGIPYKGALKSQTHEDLVSSSTHLYLFIFFFITILLIVVIKIKQNIKEFLLLIIIFLQIVFFVGYLKWQPWHTRLHIPIFMISVLLVPIAINKFKSFNIVLFACFPLLIYGFYFNFVYNNIRPIITKTFYTQNIKIKDTRFKKYFANQPNFYKEYSNVLELIYANNPKKIALMLSDWEYPLLSNFYYEKIEVVAINVNNITNKIPQNTKNIKAIVCNGQKAAFIVFEGKKYINQTPNNSYIWYFK